ncbi:MAG: biotin transporter BioY [Rhodospirillaceae bacterium]|nr:biotin transporter BioY [Rhodospirillaceae bacterium]
MSYFAGHHFKSGVGPVWLRSQSRVLQVVFVAVGVLILSGASHISIPMVPVPITLQTLAVTLVGAFYGWRLGGVTVVLWLIIGAMGVPVFSGATAGVQKFMGPTAGYLFAFPFAAMTVGWLLERGWAGHSVVRLFAVMLVGNAICLGLGGLWLGSMIGAEKALLKGVLPFLLGAGIKSAVGVICLKLGDARYRKA